MFARFKYWLIKSGVRYYSCIPPDHIHNGEEIIDYLNPFSILTQNGESMTDRMLHGGFWGGIEDTFDILVGNHFYSIQGSKGLLYYPLIFPIIARHLCSYARNETTTNRFTLVGEIILKFISGILGCILQIPRIFIGTVLTIAAIPFIAIAHLILKSTKNKLQKKVEQLADSNGMPLAGIHGRYETLNKAEVKLLEINNKFYLKITREHLKIRVIPRFGHHNRNDFFRNHYRIDQSSTRIATIEINEKNLPGINALFSLNTFKITREFKSQTLPPHLRPITNHEIRETIAKGIGLKNDKKNKSTFAVLMQSELFDRKAFQHVIAFAGYNDPNHPSIKDGHDSALASQVSQKSNSVECSLEQKPLANSEIFIDNNTANNLKPYIA